MGLKVSLQMLSDWRANISRPLSNVLAVSMDIMGRTGEEACRHCLILMAQSARKLAIKAPARRPIESNSTFRHLLRREENGSTYKEARQAGRQMIAYYRFFGLRLNQPPRAATVLLANDPKKIEKIGNRGLAKRSWMWGLGALGASGEGRPIEGTSAVFSVNETNLAGYVKENKLSYIQKAMPSGWEATVVERAGNKIMAQAARKIESIFQREAASGNHSQGFAMIRDWRDNFRALRT